MIKLIDEIDPKRSNGKRMAGKEILVRDKDDIFMSKVVLIADVPYIYRWGIGYPLESYDGWAQLPIQEIDETMRKRELDRYFTAD